MGTEHVRSPKAACVVLKDTPRAPRCLAKSTYSELSIVVVDNGSTDDSVPWEYPPPTPMPPCT